MYQTLTLIVVYVAALAAAQPPANLQPAQLATINLHRSCSPLFLEFPLRPRPAAFANWPAKRDSSTPIGSARRATRPPTPEPFLIGNCSTLDGQFRMTNLSLNNCLGWRDQDSGDLIAENSGFGFERGRCHDCTYAYDRDGFSGFLAFKLGCICRESIPPAYREFKTPGVITYDNASGRLRCHDHFGT